MNNREKAIQVIRRQTLISDLATAKDVARRLDQAGLITQDAPVPLTAANGNPVWRADGTLMVTRYPDGEIGMLLGTGQEARYTTQTARTQAALLLAAAEEEPEAHLDLPAPDDCPPDIHQPGWQLDEYGDRFAGVLAGRVWVTDRYGWGRSYDPDDIRTAAHKLLAAAEEAKRGRL